MPTGSVGFFLAKTLKIFLYPIAFFNVAWYNTIHFIKTEGKRMSKLQWIQGSCADQTVDAVVNAANAYLYEGGGICGVIFDKAGPQLVGACRQFETPLPDGSAVLTKAYNMSNAKAIIHAVGPNFARTPNALDALCSAYYNALRVLMQNGLHTIAFPLISSGIFGGNLQNPAGESARQCILAYQQFVADYPDYEVEVTLCAFMAREALEVRLVFDDMSKI